MYVPCGVPDGLDHDQWYPILRMKRSLPTLDCFICHASGAGLLKIVKTSWKDLDPNADPEPEEPPSCYKLVFICSQGHEFALCFGTHKVAEEDTYPFAEGDEEEYPFDDEDDVDPLGLAVCWWHPVSWKADEEAEDREEIEFI